MEVQVEFVPFKPPTSIEVLLLGTCHASAVEWLRYNDCYELWPF